MDNKEYGMLISNIITKLGLGIPLNEMESKVIYEFLLGQNETIGVLVQEVTRLANMNKSLDRLLAYNKAKNRR